MLTFPALRRHEDLGLLLLRIAIGAIFIVHGLAKWDMEGMTGMMATLFQVLGVVEPLMGVLVLIGLFAQPAAAVLGIIMLGAIYFKMRVMGAGFMAPGWGYDLIILAGCVMVMLLGAGKYAIDAMMGKKMMNA